jgi:signal transduction histidine kinase
MELRRRLRVFLRWTAALSLAGAVAQGAAAWALHERPFAQGAATTTALGLTALVALRLGVPAAAATIGYGILWFTVAMAVTYPVAIGSFLLLPFVAFVVVLPYVRGIPLRIFLLTTALESIGLGVVWIWAPSSEVPDLVCRSLQTLSLAAATFLSLLLLSQFARRLRETLDDALRAQRETESARAGEQSAHRQIAFLAEASTLFASSLDYSRTLEHLADLVVPWLGDSCAVDLVGSDGQVERVVEVPGCPPECQAPPVASTGHVIASGRSERLDEHVMVVPIRAGDRVIGALSIARHSASGGSVIDVKVAEEVARRAGMAIENARLYRDAQDAIRVREDFLSIASHELRTPLTSLLLLAQSHDYALASSAQSPRISAQAASMLRQVRRVVQLVERLLDVSTLDRGRLHLSLEEVDLAALVREVAAGFRARMAGLDVRCRLPEHALGHWDRLRLEQVVTNLLSNAVKYGAGHPIDVQLTTLGDEVMLEVADRGIGIPAEHRERIFDRFERAVSTRNYGGFGLGLYIVRQVVESMGGRVQVESQSGAGSRFVVTLPSRLPLQRAASPPS